MDDAHRVVFAPVDNTARVHAVVRRLTDAIGLGLLGDGEQLPSETDLAAYLGVSTVTLREALMALRQQGLIETRRGRGGGSFVRAPARPFDLEERLRSLSAEQLRDLGDHYAAIAGAAARLAAARSLPGDVRRLRRTLEEMAGTGTGDGMCRLEGRLHLEVAAASQSGGSPARRSGCRPRSGRWSGPCTTCRTGAAASTPSTPASWPPSSTPTNPGHAM
ncbi:FadR/GntR family transcriptional regulator [Actinomadura madurae]|uniref:FadR/GntR family transcriptional regulator n=1 Tax=Actinomadura madurae TaxID=1993 RepID=UPI0020D214AF|nr:GntR family transcriptional regulator [Actinomadura madurae]MCP9984052.1 GntR family transcriptional regulator [Actinomadura madurae]